MPILATQCEVSSAFDYCIYTATGTNVKQTLSNPCPYSCIYTATRTDVTQTFASLKRPHPSSRDWVASLLRTKPDVEAVIHGAILGPKVLIIHQKWLIRKNEIETESLTFLS